MMFQYVLRCSSLVTKCFCSSVSKPLGPPLGAALAPNRPPGGPQQLPKRLQDGSRTLQDASKTPPGALQDSSKSLKDPSRAAKKPPRGPRDPPGIHFDLPRGPLGLDCHPQKVPKWRFVARVGGYREAYTIRRTPLVCIGVLNETSEHLAP